MTGPMTDTYISIAEQLAKIPPHESGKRSVILTKTDQLRVILQRMTAGAELREHSAPGQITLHGLSGRFQVTANHCVVSPGGGQTKLFSSVVKA